LNSSESLIGLSSFNSSWLGTLISFFSKVSRRTPTARFVYFSCKPARRVLAFNPDDRVFTIDAINRQAEALKAPDTALFGELSRRAFGPIEVGTISALARRPIRIVGTFRLGTDLVNDGSLIMSDQNFLRFFPDRRMAEPGLRRVEVGLVRLAPEADREAIRARLDRALAPMGVDVLTKDAFMARERAFWKNRTPVGAVFLLGVALGMVVGLVICYQILSSDIADHMAEYATLKAMGRGNSFLVGIVVVEAILLAYLGFLPGVAICKVFSMGMVRSTGMFMDLSPGRAVMVLELTAIMCLGSALFAVRKLLSADPAELF
jgi:putative ABC transport system permease protein